MKRYYSVKEIAEKYDVHIHTVRKWMSQGFIRARFRGAKYYITIEDLDKFEEGIPYLLETKQIRL